MPIALKRRADTKANWTSNDPVVVDRQLAFTLNAGEFGTPLIKIGDGSTNWSNLPYINRKNNLTATTTPSVGDDATDNYSVGSMWSNVNDTDNPVVYICTDASVGAAVWKQINGGGSGGGEDLGETLYNGNTTDGFDIEFTSGDVADFTNAGVNTDLITFPSSGKIRHNAAGVIGWWLPELILYTTAGVAKASFNDSGLVEIGSTDKDGSVAIWDATNNFYFLRDTPTLSANRTETLPDGDIDWTAGASEDDYAMVWDNSAKEWSAQAITASGALLASNNLSDVDDAATSRTNLGLGDLAVLDTEEEIVGTATYDATNTGTVDLDLSTFSAHYMILTGNTTITVSNTPATNESFVRSLKVVSSTTETLTLPVGWNVVGTYVADGTVNDLQLEFSNFATVGLTVWCYINQPS